MDPDLSADLDLHCRGFENISADKASTISADEKIIQHFCDVRHFCVRFKG